MTLSKHDNHDPNQTPASHWSALLSTVLVSALLSACASKPVPPDWQSNAFAALKGFSSAYLRGNSRLADLELTRARSELSSTGRADLLARAELTRCAVRVASLEFDQCASYQPLALDATPEERAYAAFLGGNWTARDTALLPEQYRALAPRAAPDEMSDKATAPASRLDDMQDPLARLVAAGVLLQSRLLTPADVATAVDTASSQGWRRPLLAWLGVQLQRATEAGDRDAMTRLQRRIDLVLQTPA
ncbi:MAG: hypothetical protein ACYC4S_14205 [Rhodoferax sp.]